MMSFAPLRAASLASAAASPRCSVNTTRNAPNCERKSLAICGHASPVLPPADDGLTITTDILFDRFRSLLRYSLSSMNAFLFLAEFSKFSQHCICNLFVRALSIRLRTMLAQIQHLTKLYANHVFAIPVSRYLLRQTITQACDEYRDHLRLCVH